MDIAFILRTVALGVSCLANVLLALALYNNNPKSATNRVYALLSLVISAWLAVNYVSILPAFLDTSLMWIRLSIFVATAMNALFLTLAFTLPDAKLRPTGWRLWLLVTITLIVMGVCVSPLAFSSVEIVNGAAQPVAGPGMALFALSSAGFNLLAIYTLIAKFKRATGVAKQKLRYIMFGVLTLLGLLITTVLIPIVFFKNSMYISFLPLYTLIFLGLSTYAIVRHRLLDIRTVVARSATYLLLLMALGAIYGAGVFGVSRFVLSGTVPGGFQNIASTSIAIIMAFTFQPLRRFFEKITNSVFYKFSYNSEAILNDFSKIMVSELDLSRILKRSLTELCENIHLEFGQLVIFDNDRVYRVEHYGKLPQRLMVAPELRLLDRPMIVADELENGERLQIMESHGIRVSMMLRTRDEFIGYLLLGEKLSGNTYSSEDTDLLEIIGNDLAVAISNAKAYAQIQEFNLTLQARVDHATNRLRVANRHLKELDHAKDEFISMASHQLRTPLTTIKGYLSMMLEGDAGKLNKPQTEFVNYAFGSSERMVNLISDLLNVSRLSAGRFLIQTKPTDMVGMIADEVRQLQTHAAAKHIKLIFDPPHEILPPAEIDDNKTRQVVMNFIDNAIYYTQTGEVRVVLEQSGDHVRLEVRDTGIGVPEKAKRKLFSKFFRADNAQTIRPDGTGLGLYLAKRVVEDQGGTIIFSSTEGKGSTFGFELPFKPVTPVHEVPHARPHTTHEI